MTESGAGNARVPLQVSQDCIVASIQVDLRPDVLASLRSDMLELIRQSGARAVIIDLSGLDTIDPEEFRALLQTAEMARLMGALPVLSGLNAGVVSALVDLDVDAGEIEATRTLDGAFAYVASTGSPVRERRTRAIGIGDAEEADDLGPR